MKQKNRLTCILSLLILLSMTFAGCTDNPKKQKETTNDIISIKNAYYMIEKNTTNFPNLTYYLDWKLIQILYYGNCSYKDENIGKCDGWIFTYNGIIQDKQDNNLYKKVNVEKIFKYDKKNPRYSIVTNKEMAPYDVIIKGADIISIENLTKVRDLILNESIDFNKVNDSTWAGNIALKERGNISSDQIINSLLIQITGDPNSIKEKYRGGIIWTFDWQTTCKEGYLCDHKEYTIYIDAKNGNVLK